MCAYVLVCVCIVFNPIEKQFVCTLNAIDQQIQQNLHKQTDFNVYQSSQIKLESVILV